MLDPPYIVYSVVVLTWVIAYLLKIRDKMSRIARIRGSLPSREGLHRSKDGCLGWLGLAFQIWGLL